jgi:hypothetical protein
LTAEEKIWLAVYPKDEKSDAGVGKLQKMVGTAPSQNAAYDVTGDKPIKIVCPVVMPPYTLPSFLEEENVSAGLKQKCVLNRQQKCW